MSQPINKHNAIHEIEHLWIEMPDGVRLSARIWMPVLVDGATVPAILEYIPYRKRDMVRVRDERNHVYFASHGYASIRVDMRGSGDSEGVKPDMYDKHELDDAISVIIWIAQQSWCDGNVGMMGTSWGGTASLQAAARRPKPLKAIIAVCATNNRFDDDIHHMGGCLLTDSVEWGATLPAILASPPDPETVGDGWRDMWMQRLEALTFPLEQWIRHETRDEYWCWGSIDECPGDIECPVLAIGGWVDRYSNTVMNVLDQGHDKVWGIVGPWGHHYPDVGCPGPGIGFQQEAVRWWDHWLKGHGNDVDREPKLRAWMQYFATPRDKIEERPGRWISEEEWTSDRIRQDVLHLSNYGLIHSSPVEPEMALVPWNLEVGSNAGDTGYFGREGGLSGDQSFDDERSLVFETGPLDDAVEILGAPELTVRFSTDKENAVVTARLNDVSPNGDVARVSYGIKNLRLDKNGEASKTSFGADAGHARISMHNTAYRFDVGHKIRLAVSGSYWPVIWPSPEPFELTLSLGDSLLTLPVRPYVKDESPIELEKPVVPHGSPNSTVVSTASVNRHTELNEAANTHAVGWRQDFVCVRHDTIDLNFGFDTEASHTIDLSDHHSARSRFDHHMHFSRGDWQVDVFSMAQLKSDELEYKLEGRVRVEENGNVVFERQWSPRITRHWS